MKKVLVAENSYKIKDLKTEEVTNEGFIGREWVIVVDQELENIEVSM